MSELEQSNFQPGNIVYARHGPLLYEASILEKLSSERVIIHYTGWSAKHDEDIHVKYLLEKTEENKIIKENLDKYYSERRTVVPNVETQMEYLNRRSISLELPLALRARLADDFEAITKQKMLVPLPHKYSLNTVMKRFLADKATNENREELHEFCRGLIWYFNSCISTILLYTHERLQYREFRDKDPSTIYGADHLLRLLVKLPFIIKESSMSGDRMSKLQQYIIDLMTWLQYQKHLFCIYTSMSLQYMNELEYHVENI
eukprot:NODE_38_length_35257_cov_0.939047.p15 type:complete len:260 gc:universal NODE_38_length_35257_cov_0.939047:25376-24597(-)